MKIERTKNAVRNIKFGIIVRIYQLLTPFFLRTAVIYKLGIEYVGLSSLFTSILSVLSLAELGVGAAMVFSMYKPIVEDDTETICALMKLYKVYYRIIGTVVLIISLLIVPFLPHLISGNIPDTVNINILFLICMTSTVLSYWLFAYKSCLFSAHQRGDISSKITLFICTVTYILQFLVLFIWENYYLYLLVGIFTQILQNIISAKMASKVYPNYQARGNVPKEIRKDINQRVRDLFTSKLGGIVLNSADTIVISSFLGITALGIYNNYFYIMGAIVGFLDVIYYSCMAGVGNSLISETKEKNVADFKLFTFMIMWISVFCTTCFLNLYQPFMRLWMKNDDRMLLSFGIVICLCIYFYVGQINKVANLYKDAAGIWHADRFRPLVTAVVNLSLNLIMVRYIGLFGILLSTIIATICVDFPWLIVKLYSTVFDKEKMKDYIYNIIRYFIVAILISGCTYILCSIVIFDGIVELIFKLLLCTVISNSMLFLFYRKEDEFIQMKSRLIKVLGKFQIKKGFNVNEKGNGSIWN